MADQVLLKGFSIEGYRSFASETDMLTLTPVTTVQHRGLSQLRERLASAHRSAVEDPPAGWPKQLRQVQRPARGAAAPELGGRDRRGGLKDFDRPYGQPPEPIFIGIARGVGAQELRERTGLGQAPHADVLVNLLKASEMWDQPSGLLWIEFELSEPNQGHVAWPVSTRATIKLTEASEAQQGGAIT